MSDYPAPLTDADAGPLFAGTSTRARLAASDVLTPVAGVRETSRSAAKSVRGESDTQRRRVLALIVERGAYGATDEEIQNALGMIGNTQRPRRIELAESGLIKKLDKSHNRPTTSGKKAAVWVAVEAVRAMERGGGAAGARG